jgi:hypothetical protein
MAVVYNYLYTASFYFKTNYFMKKPYLLFSLFFTIIILAVSCTKEGPAGPAGATGSKGDKGDTGPAGAGGAQGPAGTANVVYSNWFTNDELSQPWADSIIDGINTITGSTETITRAIKYAPDVTSGILDSGIVLSYVRSQILISPQLLPWLFSFDNEGTWTYCQMNLVPQAGGIIYYISDQTTHNATNLSPGTGFEYRYIIIPGGVLAGGRKINPKTMSYSEICKAYNIPQ